ncbi:hypothetical protein INT45_002564 [Circinella minor]|uniref:SWIM-type domain-containing protein n=1 Tax=Circinella minor TaxID=1195481 RepID=A0A8H7VGZ5_9FUNG|nr:hypothetical protein INT45_002564 [Circinella minor]
MFPNNHSVGPIRQWLYFLHDTCSMTIQQMTIDCSIPEVNAIQNVFPAARIHYCAFHVVQAWNRKLKEKHGQLKVNYLKHVRNKQLDQLIFVLTHEVEFYFENEEERILNNNGHMVRAFTPRATRSTPVYDVVVNNAMLIESCTCQDFIDRCVPCKHIYLLKRFTNMQPSFESEQNNALDVIVQATYIQHGELNEPERIPITEVQQDGETRNEDVDILDDVQSNLQLISQSYTALHHDRNRVLNLSTISQEEAHQYAQQVRELVLLHQTMLQCYDRTRHNNTQRQ